MSTPASRLQAALALALVEAAALETGAKRRDITAPDKTAYTVRTRSIASSLIATACGPTGLATAFPRLSAATRRRAVQRGRAEIARSASAAALALRIRNRARQLLADEPNHQAPHEESE